MKLMEIGGWPHDNMKTSIGLDRRIDRGPGEFQGWG